MIATPAWPPRSLPRLYVAPPLSAGVLVTLDGGQANYLGNVLRLKLGDQLLLFDGMSGEWLASVADIAKKRMALAVTELTRRAGSRPRPRPRLRADQERPRRLAGRKSG
jgi:16S rRNA (uracil1498-N3)-methyltransferase